MKKPTFFQLFFESEKICQQKNLKTNDFYGLMFFLSKKIKSLSDYVIYMYENIDFSSQVYWKYFKEIVEEKKSLNRILNSIFFYNLELKVDDDVFMPRHDSEVLVESLIDEVSKLKLNKATYVDLCCGSGAIGIAVAKYCPELKTSFVDLNPSAIKNTKENVKKNELSNECFYYVEDWLNFLTQHEKYEIISANFPYVSVHDQVGKNLNSNDPDLALYAGQNGWLHYNKMIDFLKQNKHWKLVVLETSAHHESMWKKLLNSSLKKFHVELIYDFSRYLRAVKFKRK